VTAAEGLQAALPDIDGHRPLGAIPLAAAVGLLAAAAALLYQAINAAVAASAIVWGGLALAAYIYGLFFLVLAVLGPGYRLASWRIGRWMLLWAGTMDGLATVTLDQTAGTVAGQILQPYVLRSLWLVAAGITLWLIGYLAGPVRPARRLVARGVGELGRRYTADVRSPLTPWLLYGVGTVARLTSAVLTGRLGYVGDVASSVSSASWYGQALSLLCYCGDAGVAVAALQVFRERLISARLTLAILVAAEVGYSVAAGAKTNYASAALAVIIPYTIARGRLPKKLLAVAAVLFLAVVIPFTTAYRSAVRGTPTGILSTGQAVDVIPQVLRDTLNRGDSLLAAVPESASYLLARGQDIDAAAIIMQRSPSQIPYADPAQLVTGPLSALIPRAVWPQKPILDTGYEFGQEYYGLPATLYSSESMTPIGDLYRHGGWLPVLIGMFALGAGVRLIDEFLDVRENPLMLCLTLFLLPSLVMSEQDWITLLAGIPLAIALWVFTVTLAFRRRPAVAAPGGAA
jgi:hypothetical protein